MIPLAPRITLGGTQFPKKNPWRNHNFGAGAQAADSLETNSNIMFFLKTHGGKMIGPRSRIDSLEFRRTLSQETLEKLTFRDLGSYWKVTYT